MYFKGALNRSGAVSAVELFEQGLSAKSVALALDLASNSVQMLYERWQVRGTGALKTRDRKQYDLETKLLIVRRHPQTDVTDFTVGAAKVYVSPILDLHDNRIISVVAGPSPSAGMVTDGLRTAINGLAPDERPLVHSDQGFQYRHPHWQNTLRDAGLTQSMSRKGSCLDNASMEGFFSHLKEEWFRIEPPHTIENFHTGLAEICTGGTAPASNKDSVTSAPTNTSPTTPLPRNVQFGVQLLGTNTTAH